jgi:peroxiredoxin
MKRAAFFVIMILAVGLTAKAQGLVVGSTMENFTLPDVSGTSRSLKEVAGKNGTVVIFLSAQCPVVKAYNDRIGQAAADYALKGINFVGINSNATELVEWVRSHAAEHYKFPVLIDKGNVLADKLGANVTPEVFFIDRDLVLRYHGAIDNDRSGRNPTESYLRAAFDASLAGQKIARSSANAFGCTIKRVGE